MTKKIDDVMSLPSKVDVAIIGAGAAGLGAARALENSGLSVIVLEGARPRRRPVAIPSWPHPISPSTSAAAGCIRRMRIPSSKIAHQLNFEIDKTRPPLGASRALTRDFPIAERMDFMRAIDAFYDRAEESCEIRPATAPPVSISSPAIAGTR